MSILYQANFRSNESFWIASTTISNRLLPESQSGLHKGYETVDMVFAARVQENEESSAAFPITNEVKQGYVLAPTLFIIMFSAMLFDAFNGSDNGIYIRYRIVCSIFNLRRLQAKNKVKTDIINKFLFADNCALNTTTKANMQNSVDKFSVICDNFGLTISTKKKTEVMHQPAPGKPQVKPNITIKGQWLKEVEKFTYLGSTLSKSIIMDEEVNTRLSKVSAAVGRLNMNV